MNTPIQSLTINNKMALQAEFIELLFREKLINKETYYKAKKLLKEERDNGNNK